MDKNLHDLLQRYVKGDCTAEEVEKVNRWHEAIGDDSLHLETEEKLATRARMLSNIRKYSSDHNIRAGKRRYLFVPTLLKVAAAAILVVISGLWLFTGTDPEGGNLLTEVQATDDAVVFQNDTDSSSVYSLPDGSTVRLESSSRLRFNKSFSQRSREVHLTGKGFFDVVPDASRPFYVYSRDIATKVLGTSFLVDAPEDGGKVEVQVISGKVSVFQLRSESASTTNKLSVQKNSTANGVVLSPNQKVEYYTEDSHWVTGLVEAPVPLKSMAVEVHSFVFENIPVRTVFADIFSRFGIEVVMENERIGQCTFTGDVSKLTLYDMLDIISNSIGSSYEVKGTRILVSGKGCD